MGKKINELTEITEVPSSSYILVDDGTLNNKVTKENLMKEYAKAVELDMIYKKRWTSISGGTDGEDIWTTIFTVYDNANSPMFALLKGYAHTSILFSVSDGYPNSNPVITILNSNMKSTSDSYKYIKGIRMVNDGNLQVKLNNASGSILELECTVFGSGRVNLRENLISDTTAVPLVTIDPISNASMYINDKKVYHEGYKPTAEDIGALSLTGGTVSGITEFQDLVKAKCYSIGEDMVLNKPYDDSLDVGSGLMTHRVNLCSKGVPAWWDGATAFDIITSAGGTINGDINLSNSKNLKVGKTDSTYINALGMDSTNRLFLGTDGIPLSIQGSEAYFYPKATFSKGLNVDNNKSVNFKKSNGTEVSLLKYDTIFHIGNENTSLYLYGNHIRPTNNIDMAGLGIANIGTMNFKAHSDDAATIETTVSDSNTYLDFVIHDDANQDGFRWKASLYDSSSNNHLSYDAMTLIPGFPSATPTKLTLNGSIQCTTVSQTSDARYKTDIKDIDDNIFFELVKNSGVHSYILDYPGIDKNLKQEDVHQNNLHVGVIAQDMAQYEGSEYILNTDENENGELEYSVGAYNLASAVMAALKVEISKREAAEARIADLEEKVNMLMSLLEK